MSQDNPYQPPADYAPDNYESATAPSPGLATILFSFEGRVPRRIYWAVNLIGVLAYYVFVGLLAALLEDATEIAGIMILILYIPLIWVSLAVQAKRWHDRDKSAWWILLNMLPIIGPIWVFIEAGCMRGTIGSNDYGPDPT